MDSWSQRRRVIYAAIFGVAIVAVVTMIYLIFFYQKPSCFDNVRNGGEAGVDCGGACSNLCQNAFVSPNVAWSRFEKVAPGMYNVATYIINPNVDGEAMDVPYRMVLYDRLGQLITKVEGEVTLPPHRNTLAFKGAVPVGQSIPERVLFEFMGKPVWLTKKDGLSTLEISDKNYTETESESSLSIRLKNSGQEGLRSLTVGVVLYDREGNVRGFSKTSVDEIPALSSVVTPFTWLSTRNGQVVSIEVLPVSE